MGRGVNFALYTKTQRKLSFVCFNSAATRAKRCARHAGTYRYGLACLSSRSSPGSDSNGYRVYGPYEPQRGHRFNPNKLLLDPYAKGIGRLPKWTDACHGYIVGDPQADLSFSPRAMSRCAAGYGHRPAFTWVMIVRRRSLLTNWYLRIACQRVYQTQYAHTRRTARHIRRLELRGGDQALNPI